MARVTIEDCLEEVESRFALVHLAVRRVLQRRRGAELMVEAPKNKEVVLALREIAAAKVTADNIQQFDEAVPSESLSESPPAGADQGRLQEIQDIVEEATYLRGAPGLEGEETEESGSLGSEGETEGEE